MKKPKSKQTETATPTPDTLPNVAQLAQLSATLKTDPAAALKLWQASARELAAERERQAKAESFAAHYAAPVTMPVLFPVTNLELVSLAVPKVSGRTGDAASVFRAYCETLGIDFGAAKGVQIQEAAYPTAYRQFVAWYLKYNPQHVSAARREAGSKAWCDEQDKKDEAFSAFEKYCTDSHCKPYKRIFAAWLETHKPGPAKPPKRKLKKKLGSK